MKPTLPVLLVFTFLFKFSAMVVAQTELPNTDIYLLDITTDKKGKLQFQNPSLITKNDKYDNQPWWNAEGTYILYASVRDTFKSDIYKYNLPDRKTSVLINTPLTSEYSPMLMANKINISVVQVVQDDTTQILAKCDNKEDQCYNLLPKFKGQVAYYAWIDANRVAMYVLGDPATLLLADVSTGKVDTIAEDVGRCVQKLPGKNLQIGFVDKSSNPWQIKLYDAKSKKITEVVPTLEEEEDFCFMPDGSILMGHESELFHYVPPASLIANTTTRTYTSSSYKGASKEVDKKEDKKANKNPNDPWEVVANFDGTAVEYFYRLAVSPKGDKIAIVTYEDEKP